MQRIHTASNLSNSLDALRKDGKRIGFVPTMGALHKGHLALIQQAAAANDIVVCSIFVNPAQFNDISDLNNYPRTLESDAAALESVHCDMLFAPEVVEMYPNGPEQFEHSFGPIEQVMEGNHRPGHFSGMALVVDKLFKMVMPHRAYFGEKDFQQLAIVKLLAAKFHPNMEIVPCPTVREVDGLAMSSRNKLLSTIERAAAPKLYEVLLQINEQIYSAPIEEVRMKALAELNASPYIKPHYLEIVNSNTLQPLNSWQDPAPWRACVAALIADGSPTSKGVRIIDNFALKP